MSTVIIALLVIVLVVAVFLKKRESQSNAAPKKGASKTTKKAANKQTARPSIVREEQEPAPQATTEISESLRQKLQQQIQNGNFQTAEAQINQLLKQDNSQHELYLFLLDIHLGQKDDFAIDQLIKHIQVLKLDDIAQAAEEKYREYEKNKQPDSIEFSPSFNSRTHTETPVQNNVADFDALQSPAAQPFDDLQSEYVAPVEDSKPVEPAPEVQPLDFNFSFEQKETVAPVEAVHVLTEAPETTSPQALEFSFDLDSASTKSTEETKVEEAKPELDFNFSNLETVSNQPETKTDDVVESAPSLDFNFEQVENKTVEQPHIETTDFSFSVTEPTTEIESSELVAAAPQTSSVALNDPLAQSFPDLQQLDEAQLNLDLAEQYIELGAYESARVLLQNNSATLNAEQQQRSEKLLNKLAS